MQYSKKKLFVALIREDADEFVEKYSNPHIYDSPYASLECGILRVEELNMTPPDREDMWWLD